MSIFATTNEIEKTDMRTPRKVKKRYARRRIPQRLRYVPGSFYDFILKESGKPYCSAYVVRQSERRFHEAMISHLIASRMSS